MRNLALRLALAPVGAPVWQQQVVAGVATLGQHGVVASVGPQCADWLWVLPHGFGTVGPGGTWPCAEGGNTLPIARGFLDSCDTTVLRKLHRLHSV